jgi:outer membrane protein assembly factor BamB
MQARTAVRHRDRPRSRRWRAVRQLTCVTCSCHWASTARFCGRCGARLDRGPLPVRTEQHRHRRGRTLTATAVSAGVLVIAAIAVAFADPRALIADDLTAGTEDLVRLPRTGPAQPLADPTPATTCEGATRGGDPCAVRIVDQRVSRGALSELPPDAVVVEVGGELRRLEVPSGRLLWRTVPFAGDGDLRIRAGAVGVVVTRPGEVAFLDADSGAVRWVTELPISGARVAARTWLVEGDVFVLDTSRTLRVLDGATGEVRWSVGDVSPEVVSTREGLLVSRHGDLGLWRTDDPLPVWTLPNTLTAPLRLPGERPTSSPVRLLAGRELLVPSTGRLLDVGQGAPTAVRVLGDITLVLRWPQPDSLELTGLGAGAEVLWQRDDLDVPCCLATVVDASHGRAAVGSTSGALHLLDRRTGTVSAWLERPDAMLEGVAGDLVLWRETDHLVGTDLGSGEVVLRTSGTIRSLEPLLVANADGLIHLAPSTEE